MTQESNTTKTHPAIRYETVVYAYSDEGLTTAIRIKGAVPVELDPGKVDAGKMLKAAYPGLPGTGWRLMTAEEVQDFLEDQRSGDDIEY